MNRAAILSDIHGNTHALRAVLTDLESRDVEAICCLGDLIGKGPEGAAALDLCRERYTGVVKGNWDDVTARPLYPPSDTLRWHREQLGEARLEYLASLPNTLDFWLSGRRVRLFHASAEGIYTRVHKDANREAHSGMFENTPFTGFQNAPPTIVGYGDIHDAYLTVFKGKTLFNVGSVGNPLDDTTASYALLEGEFGTENPGPFSIHFVRVPYDIKAAIAVAAHMGMPDLKPYASELRTARYRGLP